ncbi:MAG: IS110 family transposase [Candidatus Limnocylindria bacterium]
MTAIGIDTHKATLAAWSARAVPGALIGVEGSASYGAAAARHLIATGLEVREVPPHLSRRERIHTRRAGKSDPGDALAIARVTLRETHLPPVRLEDASRELQLLVEAREDLVAEATRTRNRLHADLLVLSPGHRGSLVGPRALSALSRRLRRCSGLQAELARQRLRSLRRLILEVDRLETRIVTRVSGHPLLTVAGIGPLVAAKLLGEVGDPRRFASADAFAAFAGVAPIPASSGQTQRMRLNRGGNRQLNRALFTVAFVAVAASPCGQGLHGPQAGRGQELA